MLCDSCHKRPGVYQIVTMDGEVKRTQSFCEECFESKRYTAPETKILREYWMLFEAVPDGEHANPPEGGQPGMRSKLGGIPDWIQKSSEGTKIECESCKRRMIFVAQIDSMEHRGVGYENPHGKEPPEQHYMFADVGMLYVFWCFRCGSGRVMYRCY